MLSGEATNTNFVDFGWNRSGLEPKIYRTQGEHANQYTTDAVKINIFLEERNSCKSLLVNFEMLYILHTHTVSFLTKFKKKSVGY
jgi:hypothetical protein